jgi:hypothetical protein
MLAGAFIAWNRQEPFLSDDEVRAVANASDAIAGTDAGSPLAFLVNEPDASVSFLATRAGNVIRAGVPVDRIRDVVVVVPPLPDGTAEDERRALERLTASDLRDAERTSGRPATLVIARPFDEVDPPGDAIVVTGAPPVGPSEEPGGPLEPSSPGAIALSSVLALALVGVAGYGWARLAVPDPISAAALAPAVGASAIVLVAIALERVGFTIGTAPGGWAVSAVAGGGGYVAWRVLERRTGTGSTPEVEQ